jgi:hypothetical protein
VLILIQIQSTFMIDLQQISLALTLSTNRSLLIIDEFGKGTDWSGWLIIPSNHPVPLSVQLTPEC